MASEGKPVFHLCNDYIRNFLSMYTSLSGMIFCLFAEAKLYVAVMNTFNFIFDISDTLF